MNYYPFNIGDYTTHTMHLDESEDLAYRRLLDLYYLREMPLPDAENSARLIRMRDRTEVVAAVLSEFFTETPDGWRNPRADEEIAAVQMKAEAGGVRQDGKQSRIQRFRLQRSVMFQALHEVGIHPVFNAPMSEVRRLFEQHCSQKAGSETPENVTASLNEETGVVTGVVTTTNADATAIHKTQDTRHKTQSKEKRTSNPKRPETVSEQVWIDWLALRAKKRAPVTDTVLGEAAKEAGKAGLTLDRFLTIWCARGSQGLQADWLRPDERQGSRNGTGQHANEPAWRTEQRERVQQAAPYAVRKPRAHSNPDADLDLLNDLPPSLPPTVAR